MNPNKILFHTGQRVNDYHLNGNNTFMPLAIEIHPTAKCNHKCIHCSYKERNEHRLSLSTEVMEQLMESVIKMGIKAVYFSGGGEPALYPNIASYIKQLAEHNIESAVLTNGTYLEKSGIMDIANLLNYIAISVPSVNEDNFYKITNTNNLRTVLEIPSRIKKQHGEASPIIGARIVLTKISYPETVEIFSKMIESQFDYAIFKIARDYEDSFGLGLNEPEINDLKSIISGIPEIDDKFTNLQYIFDYLKVELINDKCVVNDMGLLANVSTDGKVYPNIVEIDNADFCIGDLYKDKLENIWNGGAHWEVKRLSNEKWKNKICKNCRAISYNNILHKYMSALPAYMDYFI